MIFLRISHAAERQHRRVARLKAELSGKIFARIGLHTAILALVEQVSRFHHHKIGRFKLRPTFRQRMLNALVHPDWAIKHDKENHLVLDYYSVNGMNRVTVLEAEKKLKFEDSRVSFLDFLNRIHATTIRAEVPDLRVRGWIYYNYASIWFLLFMTFSGLYLWLASRPGWRSAAARSRWKYALRQQSGTE